MFIPINSPAPSIIRKSVAIDARYAFEETEGDGTAPVNEDAEEDTVDQRAPPEIERVEP